MFCFESDIDVRKQLTIKSIKELSHKIESKVDEPIVELISWRTSGLRVTIPEPRGKKSLPTKFSKTDDFPADCPPTTAICGKSKDILTPEEYHKKGTIIREITD